MLQYITNTDCKVPVEDQILRFIDGGGRWVQIRMKEADDNETRRVVELVKPRCVETETFLLLDDRVDLAKEVNVGGVHVGKDDMPPGQARAKLGPAAVIGATANSLQDILAIQGADVDYVGLGPYAHTLTKKKLAPILGVNGIRDIVTELQRMEILIPIVAIGGITLDDVEPLLQAGVNGIAVSGDIAFADDIAARTRQYVELMPVGY